VKQEAKQSDHRHEELDRRVRLEFGRLQRTQPDGIIFPVEVGVGFRGSVLKALQEALRPFGEAACKTALGVLQMHRLTYGQPGCPDLVGAVAGRFVGLEVKTEWDDLSEVQREWHGAAKKRGAFSCVIRDPREVAGALERARRGEVE
jgi:hypothetical protein